MSEPKLNVIALHNVIKALRESKNPLDFRMTSYANHCGTPACCLGHYASRTDLQNVFELSKSGGHLRYIANGNCCQVDFDDAPVREHFGIDIREAFALFSGTGCNGAYSIDAAVQFIENFIKEKESAQSST